MGRGAQPRPFCCGSCLVFGTLVLYAIRAFTGTQKSAILEVEVDLGQLPA
jgi:hypothetical protein